MNRVNLYISGVFFAALVSLPLVFIIGLHIAQWRAQNAAKENLEQSSLQTIVLKARDLHWEKKGKELRIGSQLFDVKYITYQNGHAVVTGLYDEDEMAIEKKINDTTGSGNNSVIALLLLMQSFGAIQVYHLMVFGWLYIRQFKSFMLSLYLAPVLQVLHPPPLFLKIAY